MTNLSINMVCRVILSVWISCVSLLISSVHAQIPGGSIAYWHLDEATSGAYVDSIAGHDGSCPGTCPAPDTNGAVDGNGAQLFDGSTTSISVPSNSAFDWAASDSFAVEVWVNRGDNGFSGSEVIVGRDDSDGDMMWSLGINGSGQAVFKLTSTSDESIQITSSSKALSYNHLDVNAVWHHLVAVKEGDLLSLYVDGEEPVQQSYHFTDGFASADAGISIGRLEAGGGEQYFKGAIDEVAIYGQSLSPEQIKGHYFLARGYDNTVSHPIRIMPMGDSITTDSAFETRDKDDWFTGYRRPLWNDLRTNGFPVDFTGSEPFGDFAKPTFDHQHAGFPGIKTMELYSELLLNGYNSVPLSLIPFSLLDYEYLIDVYPAYDQQRTSDYGISYLSEFPTDIILLHIGTNGLTDSNMQENLDALVQILDHFDSTDERMTVVLARIINRGVLQYPHKPTTDFNVEIGNLAQQRIADGDKIIVVDQEQALNYPDDMSDNLHPNMNGYDKMAGVWYEALDTFLPVAYTITASAGENGTIEPAGQVKVEHGAGQMFSFVPDTGYHVEDVTVDTASIGTPTQYLFENTTGDHSIHASYTVNIYSIRFTSGENGTISGNTIQSISHGSDSIAVEALPNTGYKFSGWDGDYTGSENPLVVQSVTNNMDIQANFVDEGSDPPEDDPSEGGGGGCFIANLRP